MGVSTGGGASWAAAPHDCNVGPYVFTIRMRSRFSSNARVSQLLLFGQVTCVMRKRRCQFVVLLLAASAGYADQLPSRAFTTQDGLPVNRINDILADSHGLLWFASNHGLTRFDGYDFHTFTEEDGLPSSSVTALMEARDGTLWLGTGKHLCHFQPRRPENADRAAKEFTTYDLISGNEVTSLFEDHRGRIWCGTRLGLLVLNPKKKKAELRKVGLTSDGDPLVSAIAEDSLGTIWVSCLTQLYRIEEGLPPQGFRSPNFGARISSMVCDSNGRIWMGTWNGLFLLRKKPQAGDVVEHTWTEEDGLSSRLIQGLFKSRDGRLWALTEHGLSGWDGSAESPQFHKYEDTGGWLTHGLYAMAEDPAGALWVITEASGAVRLARNGLTRFEKSDGLRSILVRDVMEDRAHNLIAVTRIDSPEPLEQQHYRGPILHVLKGNRLVPIVPLYPKSLSKPGWGERQIVLQDHCREWWIATEQGLLHYPAANVEDLAQTRAIDIYSKKNGLPANDIFRLAEDRAGNIWIGTMGGGVSIWHRDTEQISHLIGDNAPSELISDRQGSMWIGWWYSTGLVRYQNGKLKRFDVKDGLAKGAVRGIVFDHAGRLWVACTGGLSVAENPNVDSPHFRRYSTQKGLSARELFSIAEGADGALYIGSENGLDELDPATERIRHYGMQDGLPTEEVLSAFRDSKGVLWFGTHAGLVRLQPAPKRLTDEVQLRVTSLLAGGQNLPLSKRGESRIEGLRVDSGHNSLEVRYADVAFGSAGPLLYQYQVGTNANWSNPSSERTLTFAGLAPAEYKIRVRAVDPLGHIRSAPVALALTVLPPFWRNWWFELMMVLVAAATVWLILHYRITRIMAVQQIRTRISSDLHDDIGSGLSQIAIWSDIALREKPVNGHSNEALERIAASSRSLVDNISDIVWTVNPRRDSLRELLQRIRYFASEVCSSLDIALEFNAPEVAADRVANSMLRHDVFLMVKEAIYNAARHSACSVLRIDIEVSAKMLDIRVADNGKGMPATVTPGNGLQTMRQRAQQLGGRMNCLASEPHGTTVRFNVPLRGRQKAALRM